MTTDLPVILDVGQLEALLRKTFNIGLDVGRGREKVDLVRLRLSKALLGAAEAQALAAESIGQDRDLRIRARSEPGQVAGAAGYTKSPCPGTRRTNDSGRTLQAAGHSHAGTPRPGN